MADDPIISDLQYVLETGQELDILNFYRSFPITCKARVESIDRDVVSLKVQPPGSVCLESEEQTIVLSRGLPEAVRARIISFDLVSGSLKLDEFSFVGSHFGERMLARVQPDESIQVEIEIENQHITGLLADVSLSGIGMFIESNVLQRGQLLKITLRLPENSITLPGKVLNIHESSAGQYRLSIGFTRNAQEIAVIMRYIKDSRMEILGEIDRKYNQAVHEKNMRSDSQ